MKIERFEDLEVWQLSRKLVNCIYKMTNGERFSRDFGLTNQIQRSSVSVMSNIAEGFARNNNNELIQFLRISKGSCAEATTQLNIAYEIGYLEKEEYSDIFNQLTSLNDKLSKFINYLRAKRKNKEFINK